MHNSVTEMSAEQALLIYLAYTRILYYNVHTLVFCLYTFISVYVYAYPSLFVLHASICRFTVQYQVL